MENEFSQQQAIIVSSPCDYAKKDFSVAYALNGQLEYVGSEQTDKRCVFPPSPFMSVDSLGDGPHF